MPSEPDHSRLRNLLPRLSRMAVSHQGRYLLLARLTLIGIDLLILLSVLGLTAGIVGGTYSILFLLPRNASLAPLCGGVLVALYLYTRRTLFLRAFSRSANVVASQKSTISRSSIVLAWFVSSLVLSLAGSTEGKSLLLGVTVLLLFLITLYTSGFWRLYPAAYRYFFRTNDTEGVALDRTVGLALRSRVATIAAEEGRDIRDEDVILTEGLGISIGPVSVRGKKVGRKGVAVGYPMLQGVSSAGFDALLRSAFYAVASRAGELMNWCSDRLLKWQDLLNNGRSIRHQLPRSAGKPIGMIPDLLTAHLYILSRLAMNEGDRRLLNSPHGDDLISALAHRAWRQQYIEHTVWPELLSEMQGENGEETHPVETIALALSSYSDLENAKLLLNESMRVPEAHYVFPTVPERLAMLGEQSPIAEPLGTSAADELLGQHQKEIVRNLDAMWKEATTENRQLQQKERVWREDEMESLRHRLENEEEPFYRSRLLTRLAWLMATERRNVHDESEQSWCQIRRALDEAIEADPEYPHAHLALGEILIHRGEEEEGLKQLQRALEILPEGLLYGLPKLDAYLRQHGRAKEAEMIVEEHQATFNTARISFEEIQKNAHRERQRFEPDHLYESLALAEWEEERIREILREHSHVSGAWIVEKRVEYFPEHRCFLLGMTLSTPVQWTLFDPGAIVRYLNGIAEDLSFLGNLSVYPMKDGDPFSNYLRNQSDAEIFRRSMG